MITALELQSYLADFLRVAEFNDYCVNGIQVEGKEKITRIAAGVSASDRLFRAASQFQADAVIVHHGLFWNHNPAPFALTGILKRRVKLLLDRDIALLAYHLPLDGHPEIGNNALIARTLKLKQVEFLPIKTGQPPIATVGCLSRAMEFERFVDFADRELATQGIGFKFNRRKISKVYVLSGGGAGYIQEVVASGADLMVTGELREETVRAAEEQGLSLYAGGHYNTEKWGIRALSSHLAKRFKIASLFIDVPNPV